MHRLPGATPELHLEAHEVRGAQAGAGVGRQNPREALQDRGRRLDEGAQLCPASTDQGVEIQPGVAHAPHLQHRRAHQLHGEHRGVHGAKLLIRLTRQLERMLCGGVLQVELRLRVHGLARGNYHVAVVPLLALGVRSRTLKLGLEGKAMNQLPCLELLEAALPQLLVALGSFAGALLEPGLKALPISVEPPGQRLARGTVAHRLLPYTRLVHAVRHQLSGAAACAAHPIRQAVHGSLGVVDLGICAPARSLLGFLQRTLQRGGDEGAPHVEVRVLAALEVHDPHTLDVLLGQVFLHVILLPLWGPPTEEPAGIAHLNCAHGKGAKALLLLKDLKLLLGRQKRPHRANELVVPVGLWHVLLHNPNAAGHGAGQARVGGALLSRQQLRPSRPLGVGDLRIVPGEVIFRAQGGVQILQVLRLGDVLQGAHRPLHHRVAQELAETCVLPPHRGEAVGDGVPHPTQQTGAQRGCRQGLAVEVGT
mmetsp:Transcript_121280/g.288090  ORF Transcript_121280/g.288090 Transcript_121280/m.288090 type:complete len:480 (-) Transcript_121280:653-2092(-)